MGWVQMNDPYGTTIDDIRFRMSYEVNGARNFPILFGPVILLPTLRVMLWLSGVR